MEVSTVRRTIVNKIVLAQALCRGNTARERSQDGTWVQVNICGFNLLVPERHQENNLRWDTSEVTVLEGLAS